MPEIEQGRPYLMPTWPQSDGRTLLAHAFAFFCALEWGFSPIEIDHAFNGESDFDPEVRRRIHNAAQLIGRSLQQGQVNSFSRPFGGGAPTRLDQNAWELDDFGHRLSSSAISLTSPFDPLAQPTHWIFVDTAQFDALLGLLQDPPSSQEPAAGGSARKPHGASSISEAARPLNRFLKKAEVLKIVPFSRSTLDDRIRKNQFPRGHDLGGGIIVWWESAVSDWMERNGPKAR